MSTDPKRIGTNESISDLYARVRALERQSKQAVDWALANGPEATIGAGGTQTYITLDSTCTTSNPSVYDMALGSGLLSALYGFRVLDSGTYLVLWTFLLSSGTPGDRIQGYYTGDIGVRSQWLFGYDDLLYEATTQQGTTIHFAELLTVDASDPTQGGPEIPFVQDHDAGAFHALPSVLVVRLPASV